MLPQASTKLILLLALAGCVCCKPMEWNWNMFDSSSEDSVFSASINDSVKLICPFAIHDKHSEAGRMVNWLKDGRLFTESITADMDSSIYTIKSLNTTFVGRYNCERRETRWHKLNLALISSTSPTVMLRVVRKPDSPVISYYNNDHHRLVTKNKALIEMHENEPLNLTCTSKRGLPKPSVSWIDEDDLFNLSHIEKEIQEKVVKEDQTFTVISTLTIKGLTREQQQSRITCMVSHELNGKGDNATIKLLIENPPRTTLVIDANSLPCKTVTMKCIADANPAVNVFNWFLNDKLVPGVTTETWHLEINESLPARSVVTCLTKNAVGESTAHLPLDFGECHTHRKVDIPEIIPEIIPEEEPEAEPHPNDSFASPIQIAVFSMILVVMICFTVCVVMKCSKNERNMEDRYVGYKKHKGKSDRTKESAAMYRDAY